MFGRQPPAIQYFRHSLAQGLLNKGAAIPKDGKPGSKLTSSSGANNVGGHGEANYDFVFTPGQSVYCS